MLNSDGKPRYWLGDYDAWHLLIPVALVAAVVALFVLPPTSKPAPKPVASPSIPAPMTPTAWIQPTNRLTIPARQFGALEGRGLPNGALTLWMRQLPNPEVVLARRPVGPDGRFVVRLTGFPPGDYGFRAEVTGPDGRSSSTFEVPVTLTADPAPKPSPKPTATKKAAPNRRRPARS